MKTTGLAILSLGALSLAGGATLAQSEELPASNAMLEDGQLTMDLVAPEASWAVVHTVDDQGKAGAHIGHAAVEAGENAALAIPPGQPVEGDQLMVMLHEDAGTAGTFEFSADDKTNAPIMKDGAPVSATVDVGQ